MVTTEAQCPHDSEGSVPAPRARECNSEFPPRGVGRNPSFPHTTKRRITTNLKSINNQKCKKIKLHGTLTTTKLKKQSNRTTRPVRWWTGRNCSKATDRMGGADLRRN